MIHPSVTSCLNSCNVSGGCVGVCGWGSGVCGCYGCSDRNSVDSSDIVSANNKFHHQ